MITFTYETVTPELAGRLLEEHDTAVERGENHSRL